MNFVLSAESDQLLKSVCCLCVCLCLCRSPQVGWPLSLSLELMGFLGENVQAFC
jgi:hypothetical protein